MMYYVIYHIIKASTKRYATEVPTEPALHAPRKILRNAVLSPKVTRTSSLARIKIKTLSPKISTPFAAQ